jgi:DNA invertase Pin-like site-specific DNA recombinase
MSLRLDGYVRVSRVGGREGEGYISPAVQREAIASYATELDGKIVAWHDDQDHTAGTIERPAFQHVLERLRSGESDGIVVMRVDPSPAPSRMGRRSSERSSTAGRCSPPTRSGSTRERRRESTC